MSARRAAVATLLVLLAALAACSRPLAARTYLFAAPAGETYAHPATVAPEAIRLALGGRVPAGELGTLADAASRGLARADAHHAVVYRHPDGGALRLAVVGGELVVTPLGRRAAAGEAVARFPLADLGAPAADGPKKRLVVGEPGEAPAGVARLEIDVAFATRQFVFVDGKFAGSVEPGGTRSIELPAGRVHVVVADAADGTRNAQGVDVDLVAGQAARLSVLPVFE